MNTRQYYYLSTIANYGNLSHAAQALHVSPSALSKFLAECERTFGFALFLRYNRRLYPTAVGRYVVECAQKILDEQNRMLLTMKEVTGGNRKAIRLATAPNRGAIIFSRIYNQFSRRYPDISLSLTELYAAEQPGAIARGLVDLALGAGATSSEITDIPIAHEELLVSLPASHPLAMQETIHLADLRDTPFVLQGPRHSIRLIAEQLFQQAGFQPVVAFESNDVILLDSMMHQAVGVGLVSNAHVFPCSELAYRPLNPPVHQTLHLRFPLGHTLTEPERYLAYVKNAGSVFLGNDCPESLGDYLAGPNHTLPTSGTAKFSSPLSVDDFVKKTQYTYFSREALAELSDKIAVFARAEGLEAHARAALIRKTEADA